MSKVIDVRSGGGDCVILGKALVLPSSSTDGPDLPLNGSIRFNPNSGAVEVFAENVWAPLGAGSDSGGIAAHTHTIVQVIGLVDALAQKASIVHVHPINEITGLQTALNGKAALAHQHTIAEVVSLQTSLDSINSNITGLGTSKANTVHTHEIADVNSLQTALDSKTDIGHTHTSDNIFGQTLTNAYALRLPLHCSINGKPPPSYRHIFVIAQRSLIPYPFLASQFYVRTLPTATYTINILHNEQNLGSVIIATDGTVTWTSINTSSLVVVPGDRLMLEFPEIQDATFDTPSLTILTTRTP